MIKKDINIIPDDSLQRIHVSQGDIGRTLQFVLYEGSTSYTIPVGATVKIQGVKPSGLGFSETCTWSGSTVTIDTTEAMTQEFGGIPTELQITDGTDVLGTSNFLLIVERNPHPDNTTDGTQDTMASLEVRIEALESAISSGGITNDIKQALLDCFEHVAWIDEHGQDYYDALEDALYPTAQPTSISAVYTQSSVVGSGDSLDTLKADLVVTVHYDDSTTSTTNAYTLSGTLTEGTSTITVAYGQLTTTFTVTVGYTSLAYIQSSGTQYIDTGLVIGYYDEVECTVYDAVTSNVDALYWGATDGTDAGNHRVAFGPTKTSSTNDNYSFRWNGDGITSADKIKRQVGEVVTVKAVNATATTKTVEVYKNNVLFKSATVSNCAESNMPNYSTYLFCRNDAGVASYFTTCRIYEFIVNAQGGTKRMHLVPALKNNVACMFDKVSQTYFTNSGSGNFTYE